MNDDVFQYYLQKTKEVGFVAQSVHSLIYISGLPHARPGELVVFKNGGNGQVLSLSKDYAEVLLLSNTQVSVGSEVARTNETLQVGIGDGLLGRLVNPLGNALDNKGTLKNVSPFYIDRDPPSLLERRPLEKSLETGVSIVDMVVPLAKGQRELIIGDRKTGKTEFLLQTMEYQARQGTICIYALIGQRMNDIQKTHDFIIQKKITDQCLIIASSSSQSAGLIYLTPFTAMTAAEYFRDQGHDVLLILDDMTTHARVYREISLLAKRFPGRSSFPGDIFFLHAKIVERAGNFKNGSITCLPVAESVLGDISGYIQTNLMSMTDGHIYFDIDLYDKGARPAVSPFLSVTRVGHQVQTPIAKQASRELSSFLVNYERLKQFTHFGAEVGESTQSMLRQGEKISRFLSQRDDISLPVTGSVYFFAGILSGIWNEDSLEVFTGKMEKYYKKYIDNQTYRSQIEQLLINTNNFKDLLTSLKSDSSLIQSAFT